MQFDDSGFSVSSAGDVNGDGFDDLIVGAPNANADSTNPYTTGAGESYVVFGGATAPSAMDLSTLDGTNGFVINGIDIGDRQSWLCGLSR